MQIITDGFESGDAAAKEQALTALLSWKGLGATDELYKIAKAGDAAYAGKALDGFVSRVAASGVTPELKQIMLTEAMDIASTPARKATILKKMGDTGTLQAMVLAGNYLNSTDPTVQQAAVNVIYNTGAGPQGPLRSGSHRPVGKSGGREHQSRPALPG